MHIPGTDFTPFRWLIVAGSNVQINETMGQRGQERRLQAGKNVNNAHFWNIKKKNGLSKEENAFNTSERPRGSHSAFLVSDIECKNKKTLQGTFNRTLRLAKLNWKRTQKRTVKLLPQLLI